MSQVLAAQERVLRSQHPGIEHSRKILGEIYRGLGRSAEAEHLLLH